MISESKQFLLFYAKLDWICLGVFLLLAFLSGLQEEIIIDSRGSIMLGSCF